MAQGMGGIMDLTGQPDGEPQRAGVPVADIFTGVYSVVGILAALAERERTGRGCQVDTALVDTQVGVLANQALNYPGLRQVPKRIGNAHPNIVPYQVFPVADGHIIIATGNDNQFAKLCAVLGEPEIAGEPNYRANSDRLKSPRRADRAALRADRAVCRAPTCWRSSKACRSRPGRSTRSTRCSPTRRWCIAACASTGRARPKGGTIPGVRTPIIIDGKPMAAERPPRGSASTPRRFCGRSARREAARDHCAHRTARVPVVVPTGRSAIAGTTAK